jgi:hypothetical protein
MFKTAIIVWKVVAWRDWMKPVETLSQEAFQG